MTSDPNWLVEQESTTEAAITLLIDWAKQGEIDPWDVDVIDVVDRFLANLDQLHLHQKTELNLPESGKAFLWASRLVSLKADTLEGLAQDQPDESEESVAELEASSMEASSVQDHDRQRLPQGLEHHIRRRGSAPPPKKRRVTLPELITEIKAIAQTIEEAPSSSHSSKARSRSSKKQETAKLITDLAHNENLTELANELEQFLLEAHTVHHDWLSLDQLVAWWQQEKEHANEGYSSNHNSHRVGLFWALLLLSSQSKVELSQQQFYQDLNLRFLKAETDS